MECFCISTIWLYSKLCIHWTWIKDESKLSFNSKLQLSVWGQYLLNYNNDPFVRASNSQPKNGIGIRLEYNPNMNTKISLDISKQEDFINSKKSAIQLEGKARIKF